jgi:2-oxo-4-hydroxy-4-carboxy-5-ureidoimidazoline decarboxylase
MNVESLNSLPPDAAHATMLRCCGSRRWADAMTAGRPFTSANGVYRAADVIWASLGRTDWLEAFAAHPRIGDLDSLRKKFASTADWASGEQAGVAGAADDVITSLADGNRDYEAKFGYIFIVCATGKTAAEMLAILRQRLPNTPDSELRIAAAEQAKITRLRLEKL